MQVFQQRSHGKAHKALGGYAGGLRPVATKLLLQRRGHQPRRIALVLDQFHRAAHVLFDVGGHLAAVQQTGVQQHLTGVVAAQLGNDRWGDLIRCQFSDMRCTGGNIRKAQARLFALEVQAGNVVVAVVLQHAALDDRTGGNHTDDVPLDKAFCLGGVLHLLADGHLIALSDQARHIALVAVEGHAAHGGALRKAALLAGKGKIQLPGRRDGIVEEHLVKIADAVKKNFVLMLVFDLKILLHHGRKLCHGFSSFPCMVPSAGLWAVTAGANKTRSVLHSRVPMKTLLSGSRRRWSSCRCRRQKAPARSWGRRRSWRC